MKTGHRERRHCLCGASIDARSVPSKFAEDMAALFEDWHKGDGHGPATPSQAGRIRQRLAKQTAPEGSEGAT